MNDMIEDADVAAPLPGNGYVVNFHNDFLGGRMAFVQALLDRFESGSNILSSKSPTPENAALLCQVTFMSSILEGVRDLDHATAEMNEILREVSNFAANLELALEK